MISLELNGTVGEDFTAATVQSVLRLGEAVTVTLNSGGGYASEGAAIYSLLAAHPAQITIDIIGIAASAASLIAMAGDTIRMRAGSVMMIHDPMNVTIGNSADHAKTIEELEAYASSYSKIYAARSGKTPKAAREIMKAETWMDGEQAVKAGFATHADKAQAAPYASFDYGKYQHAAKAMAGASLARTGWHRAFAAKKQHDDAFVIKG